MRRFAGWPASAAHGMAVMPLLTAAAHFVPAGVTVMPNHADLVAMVPPFVPFAGGEASPLLPRIAEQVLYVAVALAVAARSDRRPVLRMLTGPRPALIHRQEARP